MNPEKDYTGHFIIGLIFCLVMFCVAIIFISAKSKIDCIKQMKDKSGVEIALVCGR